MIAKPRKNKIVNIVGIDGSGKSTLGKGIADSLSKDGIKVQLIYCQYFAKLLYPIKRLAKHTVMKKTDEFTDYKKYIKKKTGFTQNHKVLGSIYIAIWLIDYSMHIFFKVTLKLDKFEVNVIDRYLFDIVVNISILAGWRFEQANRILSILFHLHPEPDLVIYVDLPEEVAFSRKDDIQSIRYLEERREFYLRLAKHWKFEIIDGAKKKEEILEEATALINRVFI